MAIDAVLAIIARECASACGGESDLEKRIVKAMRPVVRGHWMTVDEDVCFRGAVGGVLLSPETTEADKERIKLTLKHIRAFAAMNSGVPVDLEALAKELEDESPIKPLPLMKIWRDLREAA